MSIVTAILILVVAGVLLWGALAILNAPGMVIADPFKTILKVVIIILIAFFVLQAFFGVLPGVPRLRL
jgi:hypothetical protein